jgi:phosphoadenosine phosphosulfate reductase
MTTDLPNPSELASKSAEELLAFAAERFGDRAAIGTSLQKSGVVMIDMAHRLNLPLRVFFVDTLLNPPETYELFETIEQRYGITIERFEPHPEGVDWLGKTFGQNAHFYSRQMCCRIRKVAPLQRALETVDVWITGVRADQSSYRDEGGMRADIVEAETGKEILKINPLFDWTDEQVDAYIAEHDVPINALYDYVSPFDERYRVIGCACCHVPVKDSMDKRMGKFPWEQGSKECGMHDHGGGI